MYQVKITNTFTPNRNWYQEYLLAAGACGWQPYHFHVSIVFKSGSLKLLEPYWPVQICNGIALRLCLWEIALCPGRWIYCCKTFPSNGTLQENSQNWKCFELAYKIWSCQFRNGWQIVWWNECLHTTSCSFHIMLSIQSTYLLTRV
jgi:hypothetical protein